MNISVLRKGARPIVQRFMLSRIPTQRSFSAPAAMQDLMCDDLRQRLAKIMEAKDAPANRKSISDADLQDRVQAFQTRLNDARLSIQDCSTEMENIEEESMQASEAVEEAFAAYVDLLDDLRSASAEQRQNYGEMSLASATSLKLLRQELDALQK